MPNVFSKPTRSEEGCIKNPEDIVAPRCQKDNENTSPESQGPPTSSLTPVSAPMEQERPLSNKQVVAVSQSMNQKAIDRALDYIRCNYNCHLEAACFNDSLAAAKVYLEIYSIYGFDFTRDPTENLARSIIRTVHDCLEVCTTHTWIDYFKFKNAAFFAVWNDQELPAEPAWMPRLDLKNPRYLFGGSLYSWLHRKMSNLEFRKSFSLAILMSKKGMPRPGADMVRAAEKKAFELMTTPKVQESVDIEYPHVEFDYSRRHRLSCGGQPGVDPVIDSIILRPAFRKRFMGRFSVTGIRPSPRDETKFEFTRVHMEREVRRTTREIFQNFDLSLEALSSFVLPSSSANYNNSRSKYGTWGFLDRVTDRNGNKAIHKLRELLPLVQAKMVKLRNYVSEYYGPEAKLEQDIARFEEATKEVIGAEVSFEKFEVEWRKFFWTCVHFALEYEQDATAVPVGLAEALKVRVITKGPPVTYYVLKPLQKACWQHLQKFWNFELTGTPVTEELINQRFAHFIGTHRFHSGDYQAATDELHSWVSEAAANTFVDCWDRNSGFNHDPFRWLLLNSLTGHTYEYDGRTAPQRRGQLMGSITSFIFLCVANMALIRSAYEYSHGEFGLKIRDLPIWINGDDCLTAYTNKCFPIYWESFGKVMGFRKSVGKTYDSKEFCSINSTTYDVDSDQKQFHTRKYVNLGLLYGYKRACLGNDTSKAAHQLGPVHRELIANCPDHLKVSVHRLFLKKQNKVLETFPGPWFLPEYLCGLGLTNVEEKWSDYELKVVTAVRVLANQGIKPPVAKPEGPWQLYNVFHKFLRQEVPLLDEYHYENYDNDQYYGTAFKGVVLSLFVNGPLKADGSLLMKDNPVIRAIEDGDDAKLYKDILKVYRKAEAMVKQGGVRQADVSTIEFEAKRTCVPIWAAH